MLQRRTVILGAVGTAAGLAAAGCSHAGKANGAKEATTPLAGEWHSPGDASESPAAAAFTMTVSPAAGKTEVSPIDPVLVSVEGGTLQSVTVASGSKKVDGEVQSDGSWKSTDTMAYSKTYTVTASIKDSTGATVQKTSTFTTLKPKSIANITFQANGLAALKSGATYGVGQPVIVAFSRSVSDKAAAEKAIEVETTPAVSGKF